MIDSSFIVAMEKLARRRGAISQATHEKNLDILSKSESEKPPVDGGR